MRRMCDGWGSLWRKAGYSLFLRSQFLSTLQQRQRDHLSKKKWSHSIPKKRVAVAHNALQAAPPPLSVTNTTTRSSNIQIPRRAHRSTETTIFVIAMPSSLHTAAFEMHHEGEEQVWSVQQTSRSFDPHSREVPHVQTSICTSRSINISKPWVSALNCRHNSKNT
jgi:hypothetical protein